MTLPARKPQLRGLRLFSEVLERPFVVTAKIILPVESANGFNVTRP